MSEAQTNSRIEKQLDSRGQVFVNTHGSTFGKRGVADYLTIENGQAIAIEAKYWNGKVYPNQFDFLEKVLLNGGRVIIAYPDIDFDIWELGLVPKVAYEHNKMKHPKETFELVLTDQ